MARSSYLFTSESVSEGHPDKMADQISDAILDALLRKDPLSRVACETLIKTGMVLVAGEVRTKAYVNIEKIVRRVVNGIGYNHSTRGFDGDTCAVINAIGAQSKDIARGVDESEDHEQGAGDQGLMFGFACDEIDKALMPAPIYYAHRLMRRQAEVRKSGRLEWLEPDAKSQITFRYEDSRPVGIEKIVLSTQHRETVGGKELSQKEIREGVIEEIIKPVLLDDDDRLLRGFGHLDCFDREHCLINPTGKFVIGGPLGDCGLTGRKIIVDTYGGMARHGGGAFSGKDPSKVDRSATYMARYVASNIVAAGIARRCEVQLSYAIGRAEPTSVYVETFGTGRIDESRIGQLVREHFELRPAGLIADLDLLRPIYEKTAAYGHFGRDDADFTWEKTDKAELLRDAAGLKPTQQESA